ncbi:hypothetical protein LEP1GSC050_2825 [Leptospira broomii serovar Hurstbridge str. 5399]|uniref:Dolichyl-phosphate-mannose-protein mannosyltransferase n=2 Tax=Leptospira broomii TaxID=301541 RepID=T0FBL9_9LEPT|nr:hypothetical protein LEP1GSC050_2825 [Leptospira broomii serovar Hurstbridge str. 5399]
MVSLRGRFYKILPALIIIWSVWFAYQNRFLQDDAFITFRYSENLSKGFDLFPSSLDINSAFSNLENLSNGIGPVFNPGERVEGYTNFLWMILIAAGIWIGIVPETFSISLGLVLYLGSLIIWYSISKSILKSIKLVSLFLFLVGSNYSISSYATGGLETSLVTFLVSVSLLMALKVLDEDLEDYRSYIFLGFVFSLLILTRIDLAVVVVIISSFISYKFLLTNRESIYRFIFCVSFPVIYLVGAWFVWKVNYYGRLLPNTFNAKLQGGSLLNLLSGWEYFHLLFSTYWLGPFIILLLVSVINKKSKIDHSFLKMGGFLLIIEFAYIFFIGGDFMEFRFVVPFFPLLVLLLLNYLKNEFNRIAIISLSLSLVVSSFYFRIKDRLNLVTDISFAGVESIQTLQNHIKSPIENWSFIGRKLNQYFKNSKTRIAVTSAGAIPYYSKLYSLDILGLLDINVKDPDRFDTFNGLKSGHKKHAKISYLIEKNINLVVGHPRLALTEEFVKRNPAAAMVIQSKFVNIEMNKKSLIRLFFPLITESEIQTLPELKYFWMPLDDTTKLLVLYLTQSNEVDRAIKKEGWKTF